MRIHPSDVIGASEADSLNGPGINQESPSTNSSDLADFLNELLIQSNIGPSSISPAHSCHSNSQAMMTGSVQSRDEVEEMKRKLDQMAAVAKQLQQQVVDANACAAHSEATAAAVAATVFQSTFRREQLATFEETQLQLLQNENYRWEEEKEYRRELEKTTEERKKEIDGMEGELATVNAALKDAISYQSSLVAAIEAARAFRRAIGEETCLLNLPDELLAAILSKLTLRDRVVSRVNRRMHIVERNTGRWEDIGIWRKYHTMIVQAEGVNSLKMERNSEFDNARSDTFTFETGLMMMKRLAGGVRLNVLYLNEIGRLSYLNQYDLFSLLPRIEIIDKICINGLRPGCDSGLTFSHLHSFLKNNSHLSEVYVDFPVKMNGDELIELHLMMSGFKYLDKVNVLTGDSIVVERFIESMMGVDRGHFNGKKERHSLATSISNAEVFVGGPGSPLDLHRREMKKVSGKGRQVTSIKMETIHSSILYKYSVWYQIDDDPLPFYRRHST